MTLNLDGVQPGQVEWLRNAHLSDLPVSLADLFSSSLWRVAEHDISLSEKDSAHVTFMVWREGDAPERHDPTIDKFGNKVA